MIYILSSSHFYLLTFPVFTMHPHFTFPSIELVLATAHYPPGWQLALRHHPVFFPAPVYQEIPLYRVPPASQSSSTSYSIPSPPSSSHPSPRTLNQVRPPSQSSGKDIPKQRTRNRRGAKSAPSLEFDSTLSSIPEKLEGAEEGNISEGQEEGVSPCCDSDATVELSTNIAADIQSFTFLIPKAEVRDRANSSVTI